MYLLCDQELRDLFGAICTVYNDEIGACGVTADREGNGGSAGVGDVFQLDQLAVLVIETDQDSLGGFAAEGYVDEVVGGVGEHADRADKTIPDGPYFGILIGSVLVYQLKAVFAGAVCRAVVSVGVVRGGVSASGCYRTERCPMGAGVGAALDGEMVGVGFEGGGPGQVDDVLVDEGSRESGDDDGEN